MNWQQPIHPITDNLAISALSAALPILFLVWALAFKRMKGHSAALGTLTVGLLSALLVYRMPLVMAVMAISSGALYAFLPILWIVIPAVWLYQLSVQSGHFSIMVNSIASVTKDARLQAILVAYVFGSFLEGTAGFGVPVAISAALLVGMGYKPMKAAVVSLVANTAAVAFAGVGIPVLALEGPTGYNAGDISYAIAWLVPCLSALVPFFIVGITGGLARIVEVLPAAAVASVSYTISVMLTAAYLGPELPALVGAFVSAVCMILLLRFWKPKRMLILGGGDMRKRLTPSLGETLRAWLPFAILTALVFLWGHPSVKSALTGSYDGDNGLLDGLNRLGELLSIHRPVPFLHNRISNTIGDKVEAFWKLEFLAGAGTAVWLVCLMCKWLFRMEWREMTKALSNTFHMMKWSMVTILAITGYAYLSNYSGMSATLGNVLAMTGAAFPLVSPLIGWLGVFITGSDTSANLLFGPLQSVTAQAVGMDPLLALAANTVGGGAGKMVSMQSISIAAAAVGLVGKEAVILRKTVWLSLSILLLLAAWTFILHSLQVIN
ncbi:MAG: L-lactate permease [Gorillibacterium sp.]|nr:L-lactate permease [Gorillibacterium sp.]